MTDEVQVEARDGVQVITMDRPEARNAINGALAQGVADAVDELEERDDLRVGVLTGAGGTFCSGMDLKAFLKGESPVVGDRGLAGITVRTPRKPMIAAVEGYAVAGGFELVLACDLAVAGRGAKLGVPEVKRALVAAGGAAMLLPRRIPQSVALEMLLTGDPITAERAEALGLVNRVVDDGGALDAALELAAAIAANGPLAVATTKQIARATFDWTTEQGWAEQDRLAGEVFGSQDAQEGATAFAEKRDPVWQGR